MVSKYWDLNNYRYQNYDAQGLFEVFRTTLSQAGDTFTARTIKISAA